MSQPRQDRHHPLRFAEVAPFDAVNRKGAQVNRTAEFTEAEKANRRLSIRFQNPGCSPERPLALATRET